MSKGGILWMLCLLVSLCQHPCRAQRSTADSLQLMLQAPIDDSSRVDLLNNLLTEWMSEPDKYHTDSILAYQKQTLRLARKSGYLKGEANLYYLTGRLEMNRHNRLDKATLYMLRGLSIYESLKDNDGAAKCYMQLGLISYQLQSFEEGISYFQKSLRLSTGKTSRIALIHYLMALSYSEMNKVSYATALFDSSLREYKSVSDTDGVLNCISFIGKMYSNSGDQQKAISHLRSIVDDPANQQHTTGLIPAYTFLATAYLKNENYDEALHYANSIIELASNFPGAIIYVKEACNTLYQAYEKKGDTKKALLYLSQLNQIKDSIYNNSTLQRITELKSKYGFEQEMKLRRIEQEKKEAIAVVEKSRLKTIAFSITIVLGIASILLVVVFRNAQQKQRVNKLLNEQNLLIKQEQQRSEDLLHNILPEQTALELKEKGSAEPRSYESVTVLFTDFKNFTGISAQLSAQQLVHEINYCYSAFDRIVEEYGIEKIKTIGDSYMCAGGLPEENDTHAQDVVRAALAMRDFMEKEKQEREAAGKPFFEVRIGVNTGPVIAGIVGTKKFAYDIWGDTVNIASRMESSGEAGKVNVSGSTYAVIKNDFICVHRGKIEAKNKGEIDMYFVV